MLSKEDLVLLIGLLAEEAVMDPSPKFPFKVTRVQRGYSTDPQRGRIQAALSIALEAKQ